MTDDRAPLDTDIEPVWLERLKREEARAFAALAASGDRPRVRLSARSVIVNGDALDWLDNAPAASVHAIVTDPPYGVVEYEDRDHAKLRGGRGGVWRIPPSFDGANRRPLPRFTVLSDDERVNLQRFFLTFAERVRRVLVPGGHIFIASNPLLSTMTFGAFMESGFEKRGEVIRLVQTMRGGDKPKNAEEEFPGVSVMARSCWEPWGILRNPMEGTVAENLRKWGAGGLRRISAAEPFKDVITCSPTRGEEKRIAPHPSLKPQRLLRKLVRASLPLGIGVVLDPFAGSGSTLAAAGNLGNYSVGVERDEEYYELARCAFGPLATIRM